MVEPVTSLDLISRETAAVSLNKRGGLIRCQEKSVGVSPLTIPFSCSMNNGIDCDNYSSSNADFFFKFLNIGTNNPISFGNFLK